MDPEKVEQIVITVLETILKESFRKSPDINRQNTQNWDSLKHIEIMFALEDELGITFSEEELMALDSVKKIVDAVQHRHAA